MLQRAWTWLRVQFEPKPDPYIEELVYAYAKRVAEFVATQGDAFTFRAALCQLQADPRLDEIIADRTYRHFLRRAWSDGRISATERHELACLAGRLGINAERASEIDTYTATLVYRHLLTKALADGTLDDRELQQLRNVAESLDKDTKTFTLAYLREDGRALVELATAVVSDAGAVSEARWGALLQIVARLGFDPDEFLAAIQPQLIAIVNSIIERIACDSTLDESELSCMRGLIRKFRLGPDAQARIDRALAKLDFRRALQDPTISGLAAALNDCGQREFFELDFSVPSPITPECTNAMRLARWWSITHSESANRKYNAGAAWSMARADVRVGTGLPRKLRCSAVSVSTTGHFGSLYFLPCGVLLFHGGKFHGIPFGQLECDTLRFVESDPLPPDAVIVDRTWQLINKSGERDLRFKANKELPVCEYGRIVVPRPHIELQTSNPSIPRLLTMRA